MLGYGVRSGTPDDLPSFGARTAPPRFDFQQEESSNFFEQEEEEQAAAPKGALPPPLEREETRWRLNALDG